MSGNMSKLHDEHKYQDVPPVVPSGVVVSGEASESDEDELPSSRSPVYLLPLRVDRASPNIEDGTVNGHRKLQPSSRPKYKSLLHTKLWAKNADLLNSLHDREAQLFVATAKQLTSIAQSLSKSLLNARDICNHMQPLTNDLFHLEDKLDIVASCSLLPDISIDVTPHEAGIRS